MLKQMETVSTKSLETILPQRENAPLLLIVEDNLINQEMCTIMLKHLGYRCDVAGNGREAVDAVERMSYDLVFMDYEMPEMDGVEATRVIREREKGSGRSTTIVALTGHVLEEYHQCCIENGMDDFLAKPFSLEALHGILERWLSGETVS